MENWTNFWVLRILQGEMTEDDVGGGKKAVFPEEKPGSRKSYDFPMLES